MSVSLAPHLPRENRLLAALPASEYQRLIPHLELVSLSLEQVLYEPLEPIRYVYFPYQGIVSVVSTMEDGSTVEVGLVGNEGMVGTSVILGGNFTTTTAFVQIPASAMRMEVEQIKAEFNRGDVLQSLLLRYTQAQLTQVEQTAACNRLHTIEERLARWLLTVSDRVQSDNYPAHSGIYRPDARLSPFWCHGGGGHPQPSGNDSLQPWQNYHPESRKLGSDLLRVLFNVSSG